MEWYLLVLFFSEHSKCFYHTLRSHSYIQPFILCLKHFLSITHAITLWWIRSNLGFSVFPNSTLGCRLEEPGIHPPTFWLADYMLYLLSHCSFQLWERWFAINKQRLADVLCFQVDLCNQSPASLSDRQQEQPMNENLKKLSKDWRNTLQMLRVLLLHSLYTRGHYFSAKF